MNNQHKLIKGYRDLSQEEIELINEIKAHGLVLDDLLKRVQESGGDPRWVAVARTDLQTGCMALVRSIAKPEGF